MRKREKYWIVEIKRMKRMKIQLGIKVKKLKMMRLKEVAK
jgi:hypothetical protein